ncbi:MAG: helix-turn-helix transcriptional regulator [Vannielia sp.]|uniref:helix-turn-helix transcriptional regulator n=1 Tax=Rhodobacterales TaxID=204455 RepID=UPI0020959695|nr:helix-turn-helix transcriptional regulator [Oceanicola sp. 502str15]MCO6382011.1 helix-turn-helix domain-containing protein [Oceanicola sp. 502str15]
MLPRPTSRPVTGPLTPAAPKAPIDLVPLARLATGGKWRTEAMRSYRTPLMLWFTRGQGRITVAGLTRGYGAHNAVFIPPRTMFGFEVTAQVYGTAVFFNENSGIDLPAAPCHLRVRDALSQGEITTILENMQREIDGTRPARDKALTHHGGLLSVWVERQHAGSQDAAADTASRRLAGRYTDAIERGLYTGQSVSDYAEGLGVTSTHLSRACRTTCGRPASAILADRLGYEARRLLVETDMPVRRVAEMLGYRSSAYFSRVFHERSGQTPTAFRSARKL